MGTSPKTALQAIVFISNQQGTIIAGLGCIHRQQLSEGFLQHVVYSFRIKVLLSARCILAWLLQSWLSLDQKSRENFLLAASLRHRLNLARIRALCKCAEHNCNAPLIPMTSQSLASSTTNDVILESQCADARDSCLYFGLRRSSKWNSDNWPTVAH